MYQVSLSSAAKRLAAGCILLFCFSATAQDTDGDGVPDLTDNCSQVPNPAQLDVDADLLGNACDADFNNDGSVNFLDFVQLTGAFQTANPLFDLNGDGIVNFLDISLFVPSFNGTPGPGAIGASFASDVQPIFMSKCAPCHTILGLGGHNLATSYADNLATGSQFTCGGTTIGECALVRVRSGQMPPGAGCTGNPVTDAGNVSCLNYTEQSLVFSWINGGLAP